MDHELEQKRMLPFAMNSERCAAMLAACCSLFVATLRCEAQNLVPNGSFELRDSCPTTIGFQEGDQPLYWRTWLNSPEYFNACADTSDMLGSIVSVPRNGWSFQYPWQGDAYAGAYMFTTDESYREYLGTPLTGPMVIGENYHISFRVNMAWGGTTWLTNAACNNIGLLFTTESNAWVDLNGSDFPFRNNAHVFSSSVITDTVGWTLVSGNFTADSAYQFAVLGNFFDNVHTDSLQLTSLTHLIAYYLVDSVIVVPAQHIGIAEQARSSLPALTVGTGMSQLLVSWPGHLDFALAIYDTSGRRLGLYPLKNGAGTIPIGSWAAGIYTARVEDSEASSVCRFVVP